MSIEVPIPPSIGTDFLRRMERLSRVAGIGYWTLDVGARQVYWSPGLRDLHGLPPDAPVPSMADWLRHWVHPDDRSVVEQRLQQWLAGVGTEVLTHAFRVLRQDGSTLELITHALVDEGMPQTDLRFGVLVDVTPLRRAEQALRQAEGRAALTTEALGIGTWQVDLLSGEACWDSNMWLLRGLAPRARPPDHAERLALLHPADRDRVARINEEALAMGYEFRVITPDARVRWLGARSTTLHDQAGKPVRRIGVNWDITAQRQAEAALHQTLARERALAHLSHELRTPLNAVLGCSRLLQDSVGTAPAAKRYADEIESAGRAMLGLVDQVLELADQAPSATGNTLDFEGRGADGARRTLLYVEDNHVNAMIVEELVNRHGSLRLVVAPDGGQGLKLAAELQPDLVLLDMQLPDIDGPEVFRRLRADPRTAHLRCIALSANAMPGDINAALASGMAEYWTKPLDFVAFQAALTRLFGPPRAG